MDFEVEQAAASGVGGVEYAELGAAARVKMRGIGTRTSLRRQERRTKHRSRKATGLLPTTTRLG